MLEAALAVVAERAGRDVGFGDTGGIVCPVPRHGGRSLLSFCLRSFRGHLAPLDDGADARWSPNQIPNPKLQIPTTPNFQIPNQLPNPRPTTKSQPLWDLGLGSWLGIWELGVVGAWSLGFGIWLQSYLRATIGSTRDARRAGRNPASTDTTIITAVAATIVMASVGARPKSRAEAKGPAPREPATPIVTPIATSTIDSTRT